MLLKFTECLPDDPYNIIKQIIYEKLNETLNTNTFDDILPLIEAMPAYKNTRRITKGGRGRIQRNRKANGGGTGSNCHLCNKKHKKGLGKCQYMIDVGTVTKELIAKVMSAG